MERGPYRSVTVYASPSAPPEQSVALPDSRCPHDSTCGAAQTSCPRPPSLLPPPPSATGSYFTLSLFDKMWHPNLTVDEATAMMEAGIAEVRARAGGVVIPSQAKPNQAETGGGREWEQGGGAGPGSRGGCGWRRGRGARGVACGLGKGQVCVEDRKVESQGRHEECVVLGTASRGGLYV